ncbi:MAG: single-stranded DNA-binding protein [Glaciihabitans sp.]|nr:single-stranded DNA-binding protein [Glaciihabitans sp.]
MSDLITLTGNVATTPRIINTAAGVTITSFRLACNSRRYDKGQQRFIDEPTNFYTISTYRNFAENVGRSVHKGDRLVVTGKLKLKEWTSGEKAGVNVEVDAVALGHDMFWGQSHFLPRSLKGGDQYENTSPEINTGGSSNPSDLDMSDYSPSDFAPRIGESGPDGDGLGVESGGWPEVATLPVGEEQTTPF